MCVPVEVPKHICVVMCATVCIFCGNHKFNSESVRGDGLIKVDP